MHELCRFRAGFAGLPKTKPAKFRGILNTPEKPNYGMFIDGLCRFAGLVSLEAPQNIKKFHSVEQNSENVENLWISPPSA